MKYLLLVHHNQMAIAVRVQFGENGSYHSGLRDLKNTLPPIPTNGP